MFEVVNETDLHCKVVQYSRRFCPEAIIIAGLGENQDTPTKRINSWKKAYMKGQPDIMIINHHKHFKGSCVKFKSPNNNYERSEAQLKMKKLYRKNGFSFMISNDYDLITKHLNLYIEDNRLPCNMCTKEFLSHERLQAHLQSFHEIVINH